MITMDLFSCSLAFSLSVLTLLLACSW